MNKDRVRAVRHAREAIDGALFCGSIKTAGTRWSAAIFILFQSLKRPLSIMLRRSPIDWAPILRGVNIIIHLAGPAHGKIPENAYSEFNQVNWITTQRLADAAKPAGIERFVYISSVRAQIGAAAMRAVHEQDEPRPTNQYGRSKLAAEQAIRAAGLPFTIFRPVVIYGPNPKGNMQMVLRLARSSVPLPVRALTSHRSLLAVENLISAIIFALKNPASIGETYLVADTKPMTIGEILTMLRKMQGRAMSTIYICKLSFGSC